MTYWAVRYRGVTAAALVAAAVMALTSMLTAAFALGAGAALIMGGTWHPDPEPDYITGVDTLYIQPGFPGFVPHAVHTPEQFWPVTPDLGNLTFNESVAQGVADLHQAITDPTYAGQDLVVFGYSQSATIATIEMQNLANDPDALASNSLSFILAADPSNPDGGLAERFAGLHIPILDVTANGPTPPDIPFPTDIYSIQYDLIADAPQFPLNPLADLNALLGYFYLHKMYPLLTPDEVATAQELPVSPDYDGVTDYFMMPTGDLPLLEPLRQIPYVGPVLAELLQPDLRVLVDLGYGDGFANVPTPAGLFALFNPLTVGEHLLNGLVQGGQAALVEAGVLPDSDLPDLYPYLPMADPLLATSLWNLLTDNSQLGWEGLLGFDPADLLSAV